MPAETMTNASSVPIEQRLPASRTCEDRRENGDADSGDNRGQPRRAKTWMHPDLRTVGVKPSRAML